MKNVRYFLLVALVLISVLPGLAKDKKLTVLYTNDLHAHFEPHIVPWVSKTRKVGGFVNIATLVKREKKANKHTVYFDAGDSFSGPYHSFLTKGEAVIDAMNYLGLDASAVGNHEFDHGWDNALEQFKKAKFPLLNGNIFRKGTDKLHWNNPYIIKKVNGIRLGIIGLHGRFAFYDTTADEMIKGIEARDEEKYLRKYIKELKPKTDLIILLIHQGIPGTQSSTGEKDVVRNHQKDIVALHNFKGGYCGVSKVENNVFVLKNMNSGEQTNCSLTELINKLNLSCRLASGGDLVTIFEWSNDNLVRKNSFNSDEIKLEEHTKWYLNKIMIPRLIFKVNRQ